KRQRLRTFLTRTVRACSHRAEREPDDQQNPRKPPHRHARPHFDAKPDGVWTSAKVCPRDGTRNAAIPAMFCAAEIAVHSPVAGSGYPSAYFVIVLYSEAQS